MRIRTLLLLPIVVAIAMTVFVWLDSEVLSLNVVRRKSVPLDFLVVDERTGAPIVSAYVLLHEPGHEDEPPVMPHHVELFTGRDGHAGFELRNVVGHFRRGYFSGRMQGGAVSYPAWKVAISAAGHELFHATFAELTRRDPRFLTDDTPPSILVALPRSVR